ncbi:MAG: 3,4-dihydroxy-2-butanone-4-phosphate synthase [Candidatus Diapherotrites archaeon]
MLVENVLNAVDDLKKGKMIIVVDSSERENECDLVVSAKFVDAEKINFMLTHARGLLCVPISVEKAVQLGLPKMTYHFDNFSTGFTVSVDASTSHTGISVFERLKAIKTILSEKSKPESLRRPGHVFPLVANPGGVLSRPGHTEATIDLLEIAKLPKVGVICEILNYDGSMLRFPQVKSFAKKFGLKIVHVKDIISYRLKFGFSVLRSAETFLPTEFGDFKVFGYKGLVSNNEYLVLVKGNYRSNPLVRVHSGCITGDVFHSLRCDCKEQLHKSMSLIQREGKGVIIYAKDQEGRGVGLLNKLKAYALQDKGFDTIDANLELGLEVDSRDFGECAQILKHLGIKSLRLLSNNVSKKVVLESFGLKVKELVNVKASLNSYNKKYILAKKEKLGHFY